MCPCHHHPLGLSQTPVVAELASSTVPAATCSPVRHPDLLEKNVLYARQFEIGKVISVGRDPVDIQAQEMQAVCWEITLVKSPQEAGVYCPDLNVIVSSENHHPG